MTSDGPQRTSRTSSAHAIGDGGAISASEHHDTARIFDTHSLAHRPHSEEPVIDKPFDETPVTEAPGERMAKSSGDEAVSSGVMMAEDPQRWSLNARTGASLNCALGSEYVFRPIPVPEGYPELKYKPIMLSFRCMLCVLAFYLFVLGLLISLIFVHNVSFSSQYGYFGIQILPPVVGTITTSLWSSITISFGRISPYIASASDDSTVYKRQNSARRTILAQYFPVPDIFDMIGNGNVLLVFTHIVWFLSDFVLAFKAALLNTTDYNDYWEATVTFWALYSLIAVYLLLTVCLIALVWHLRAVQTGLLWDPVSIADHLVLFRHSNFLAEFDGMEASSRHSLHERFRRSHFRLGYWDRGSLGIWHGFGRIEHDLRGKLLVSLSCVIARLTSRLGSVRKNAPESGADPSSNGPGPDPDKCAQSLLPLIKAESSGPGQNATCRHFCSLASISFVLKM